MDTDGIELRDGLDKAGLREVNIKVVEKELHHAESTGGVLLCRKYKEYFQKNKAGEDSLQQLDKDLDRQRKELSKKHSQIERRFITIQVVRKDINPYIISRGSVTSKAKNQQSERQKISPTDKDDFVKKTKYCTEEQTDIKEAPKHIDTEINKPNIIVTDEHSADFIKRQSRPTLLQAEETVDDIDPTNSHNSNYIDDIVGLHEETDLHNSEELILPDIHSVVSQSPAPKDRTENINYENIQDECETTHLPSIDVTQSCDNIHSSEVGHNICNSQLSKSTHDLSQYKSPIRDLIEVHHRVQREGTRVEFKQLRDRFRHLKESVQEPKEKTIPKFQTFLGKPKLSRSTNKTREVITSETLPTEPKCGHNECRLKYIESVFRQEDTEMADDIVYNKLVDRLRMQLPKNVASKLEVFRTKLNDGVDYETIRMRRLEKSRKKNALRALDDPRWLDLEETMKKPPQVRKRRIKVAKPQPELYDRRKLRFFAAINWM